MHPLVHVGFILFSANLVVRSLDPLVPQISMTTNVSIEAAAALSTALAIAYAVVQPILGVVGDVIGKRRVMIAGAVVITVATLGGALAPNYTTLLVSRILTGLSAGAILPVSLAIASDMVPATRVQETLGRLTGTALTATLVGSLVAGSLGGWLGWRAVLWAGGGLLAITLIISTRPMMRISSERHMLKLSDKFLWNIRSIFGNRNSKICFSFVFIEGVFVWGLFPYVGYFLIEQGEIRTWVAGIIIACFGIGGIIYAITVGRMLKILDSKSMIGVGSIFVAMTLSVFGLSLPWWLLSFAFVIAGVSFYMMHGCIQRYVVELAPSARGTSVAFYSTFFYIGQAAGPVAYGFAVPHLGRLGALVLAGATIAISARVAAILLQKDKNLESIPPALPE